MSQRKPKEPVARKPACQPYLPVARATRMGAMKKLTLVPELKRPVAVARSSAGNHSEMALMAAGKLPDSPMPRKRRAMQKPATEKTRAWPMEERAQMAMAKA